jgi:hypothetical protein
MYIHCMYRLTMKCQMLEAQSFVFVFFYAYKRAHHWYSHKFLEQMLDWFDFLHTNLFKKLLAN